MNKDSLLSNINYQLSEQPVLFIVGVTATGKSALAMKIALELDGEIICADSQTIRRGLDIGTAKPSLNERREVPHYMLDVIGPYERFSVAQFKIQAEKHISDINERGKLAIVVGGTGLYVDALFYDYELSASNNVNNQSLDQLSVVELQSIIEKNGWDMPENNSNPRHLIGTILRKGSKPHNHTPINNAIIVGMKRDDEVLKKRIEQRAEEMFESGVVKEVFSIIDKFGRPPSKFDAIIYAIILRYVDEEISLDQAIDLFKKADWQYARRQKAWFKRNKHIQWFTEEKYAVEHIRKYLSNRSRTSLLQ